MAAAVHPKELSMRKLLARVMVFVAIVAIVPYACANTPGSDDLQAPDLNVNSRYTIESVHISGWHGLSISDPLRNELDRFVGAKLNHPELEKLAAAHQARAARLRSRDQSRERHRTRPRDCELRGDGSTAAKIRCERREVPLRFAAGMERRWRSLHPHRRKCFHLRTAERR